MVWRWLESEGPQSPEANMAIDTALLAGLVRGDDLLPVVRVYTWDRPCVTCGRHQDIDAVRDTYQGLPVVVRPTGGLAVYHEDDLTFSVVTRENWLPRESHGVLASYRLIVGGLTPAFQSLGLQPALGRDRPRSPRSDTLDCFRSASACDLIDIPNGRKLMGCAQRRESGAILQQMTIPVQPLGAAFDRKSFVNMARKGLSASLGVSDWR
jgi:lipoate-protein ligase A